MSSTTGLVTAEQNLLAFLIKNPSYLDKVQVAEFASTSAKHCVEALLSLKEKVVELRPDTFLIELSATDPSFREEQIRNLWNLDVGEQDFHYLHDSLKKSSIQYDLQQYLLPQLIKKIASKDLPSIEETEYYLESVHRMIDKYTEKRQDLAVLDGTAVTNQHEDVLRQRSSGKYFRSSGDGFLDKHISMGFEAGTQSVLFGSTGSGKTNFALSLFLKQINRGIPCVYVSLEMPMSMLMDRLFAAKHQLPIAWLYPHLHEDGVIPDFIFQEYETFKEAISSAKNFRIVDEPSLNLDQLEKIIADTKKILGVDYLAVTVDLTTMLTEFTTERGSRADIIEQAMNKMNIIAKRQNCHILNVVQSNRNQDSSRVATMDDLDRLRPSLNHIKASNAIAERSRLVMGLFRKKHYAIQHLPDDPETQAMDDILEVSILKQSQGQLSRLEYLFDGETASVFKYNPREESLN